MSDKKKKRKSADKKTFSQEAAKKSVGIMQDWFLMCQDETDIIRLKEILSELPSARLEVWKEMGVIECSISEQISMDIEQMDCDFQDEEGNAFLKEHQIKRLYAVTIQAPDADQITTVLETICNQLDGFFCTDSEDFMPMIGNI